MATEMSATQSKIEAEFRKAAFAVAKGIKDGGNPSVRYKSQKGTGHIVIGSRLTDADIFILIDFNYDNVNDFLADELSYLLDGDKVSDEKIDSMIMSSPMQCIKITCQFFHLNLCFLEGKDIIIKPNRYVKGEIHIGEGHCFLELQHIGLMSPIQNRDKINITKHVKTVYEVEHSELDMNEYLDIVCCNEGERDDRISNNDRS